MRLFFLTLIFWSLFFSGQILGACGGTTHTWDGSSSNNWNTAANWTPAAVPNGTTDDLVIQAASRNVAARTATVGCVDINSGTFRTTAGASANGTLTITGDYFKNLSPNTMNLRNADNYTLLMAGTAEQDFSAVDVVDILEVSNNTTVNITKPGTTRTLSILGASSTVNVTAPGEWRTTTATTIPAGTTVVINNGATWYSTRNITVNGLLKIQGGGTLKINNGRRLIINSGGIIQLNGASGNVSTITTNGANRYFYLDMAGTFSAEYFRIDGLRTNGLDVQAGGSVTKLENGEFRNGRSSVDYITLAAGVSLPAVADNIGFYDDYSYGNQINVRASSYSGSNINFTNYSGDLGGASEEVDPNNVIDWGTPAATKLSIVSNTPSSQPGTTTSASSAEKVFAVLSTSLTTVDATTDITSITVTLDGTGTSADLSYVRLYKDTNGNCLYDDGTDTQVDTDKTLSGSPAQATFSLSAGDVQTDGPSTRGCFILTAATSAIANDGNTIKLGVASTSDIVNSENYDFSVSSGPPIYGNQTTINSGTQAKWTGATNENYSQNNNWVGNRPSLANGRSCQIAAAINICRLNTGPQYCKNADLTATGTMDFDSTTREFIVSGVLDVASGFTFSNASSGQITMGGSTHQNLSLASAFPGNLYIDNSGASGANTVSVTGDSTVNGNVVIEQGGLEITTGVTLTVLGDVTVESGASLEIQAGGTLRFGNGSTLTIDSGGTFSIVGSMGSAALVTSTSTANSYNVIVNGLIEARYYTFENLGPSGVSIESGASIDASNFMQDGNFLYPIGVSVTLLSLKRQIPGNTLTNMTFSLSGSGATGVTNIDTTGAAVGTLIVDPYSGDLAGASYDTDPSYIISWIGATNTIDLTQEETGPGSVNQATTYIMGRFGFKQSLAGASYNDSDLTALTVTMTGTGTAADVDEVRVFADTDCDSASGTLIGSGPMSGSPAKKSFGFPASTFTIPSDVAAPSMVCLYVEYDIASSATASATVGVEIATAGDLTNSEGYALSAITPAPVNLGSPSTINAVTTTIWTGGTSSAWSDASNWSAGVPSGTKSCLIPNQANDPSITSGTIACKNVVISSGVVTLGASATFDVYGSFENTGTFNQTGTLNFTESDGSTQTIESTSSLGTVTINKTASSILKVGGASLTINDLTFTAGQNINFTIPSSKILVLPNGLTLPNSTFTVASSGELQVGNGQTLSVTGGHLKLQGTADIWPQNLAKAKVSVQGGAGTWSFSANSGELTLSGFHVDRLDTNGLNITGTTQVNTLRGGQITNLPTSYSSVKAIQLNTTGSIPATADNIFWNWGGFNSEGADSNSDGIPDSPTPANSETYLLATSTGCGSQTIDFTNWTGDWFEAAETFDVDTKVSASGCTINMSSSSSAVTLQSLSAIPYNNAVDIRWITAFESNHLGFNVFRADEQGTEFVQVNEKLIYNFNTSGSKTGSYRFIDYDVTNGIQYFYYIQDIEIDGTTAELHGPVIATPLAALSSPPVDQAGQNSGTNPDDTDPITPGPGTITNPSFRDLGDGIVILSQTSSSLRIQITPEAATYSASLWNGAYEDVRVAGFGQSLTPGSPEMPVRDLLIEVHRFATTAVLSNASVTQTNDGAHILTPAPLWSVDGAGVLQPSYNEDASIYSANANIPNSFYVLESNLISVGERKFLKLKINPLMYNPVTDSIAKALKVTLDIGLDGNAWETTPPAGDGTILPGLISNTLRIKYTKTGMMEVGYDDLDDSNVEGPFIGTDTDELRLFYKGAETALEVVDSNSNSIFDSGDLLRFYAIFEESLDDNYNMVVLADSDILSSGSLALRIEDLDGDPSNTDYVDGVNTLYKKVEEQNIEFFTEVPIGDALDHFFWKRLFSFTGLDELDFTTNLPQINVDSDNDVEVKIYLKSRLTHFQSEADHHLEIYVNDMVETAGQVRFDSHDRLTLTTLVDPSSFVVGDNSIRLKITGNFTPIGDYDVLYIDKVEFNYYGEPNAEGGLAHLSEVENGFAYSSSGHSSSSVGIYDVSIPREVQKLSGASTTTADGGISYDVEFFANPGMNDEVSSEYYIIQDNTYDTPSSLGLTPGYPRSLRDSGKQADMIIIGSEFLLNAATDLVSHREGQGLNVELVTLDQIYVEFSHGQKSAKAIQDFVQYALNSWGRPSAKYLLLLGDATFNPRGHAVASTYGDYAGDPIPTVSKASGYESTFPLRNDTGLFWDFGDDHYFARDTASILPDIAVGRIPTNNAEELQDYISKVISYENGSSAPVSGVRRVFFMSDEDQDNEKFKDQTQALSELGLWSSADLTTDTLHRDNQANEAAMTAAINNNFQTNTPLLMTFIGHGATNKWGTGTFSTSQADSLANIELPIVMALNCDNAYFYNEDLREVSLSESMIFNNSGGAVAFLGTTTWTTPSAQTQLGQAFYSQFASTLSSGSYETRLGTIFQRAKVTLGSGLYTRDIQRSLTLIGDPALKLPEEAFSAPINKTLESSGSGSGGGGCSLIASNGEKRPWFHGLLEWAFIWLVIIAFGKYSRRKEECDGNRNS